MTRTGDAVFEGLDDAGSWFKFAGGDVSGFTGGGEKKEEGEEEPSFFARPHVQDAYKINPANPEYVQQAAADVRNASLQAAGDIRGTAQASQQIGQQAQQQLGTLGQRAMTDIAGYGMEQAGRMQNLAQRGGGDIVEYGQELGADLRNLGGRAAAGITGTGQVGAQQLGSLSAAAQAAQAQAAGRQYSPIDFAAANQTLGGVTGLQGQLAGLEAAQGPSAAQAQLQSGLNAAQQSNLALARSGRGWGGSASALSQAAVQNAQAGQQAANQAAMLRASEDAAWRQRQAANLGAAGQMGLGVAGQQAGQTQFGGELGLRQQALSDQTALGYGAQALQGAGMSADQALQGAIAGGQLGVQSFGQGAQLGLQGTQAGYEFGLGGMQAATETGLGAMQVGYGMGLDATAQGAQLGMQGAGQAGALYGAGAQQYLGGIGMENQLYQQEQNARRAAVQDTLTKYGIDKGVAVNQQQMDNQMIGAGVSAGAALLPLLFAASDRDAKTGIEPAGEIRMPMASGSRGVTGPGGPDYDKAMGSAARAARRYGSEQEGKNLIELPLDREKFLDMAQDNLKSGLQRAGSMLNQPSNPYLFNPYAQQYLASDERSKMRVAQLEGQVMALGGDPNASTGRMPLAYDPGTGVAGLYRVYDPSAESTGGFRRTDGSTGTTRVTPESRFDRAALDEAYRRESGLEPVRGGMQGAPAAPPTVRDVSREDFFPGNYRVLGAAADTYSPYSRVDIDALDDAYRRQTGLEPVLPNPRDAAEAIGNLQGYTWEYKDPDRFGHGRQLGVMAQDVAAEPVLRDAVGEARDGTLLLDASKMTMANTAALSSMQKDIERLKKEQGIKENEDKEPVTYNPFTFAPSRYDQAALDEAYRRSGTAPGVY